MTRLDSTTDVWKMAFWILYFVAMALIGAALIGCIKPTTMYGNVYQCPQGLIERVDQHLSECKR